MARPKKNNVEYFPHTVTHGKKMSYIEKKYKNDGYATWFKILEELGNTDNHYLNLSDDVQIMFLSDKCLISEELLIDIINDLVRLKEFDAELWNDNKVIYCEKFTNSIEDAYSKRKNTCINKDELIQLLVSLGARKQSKSNNKQSKSSQSGVKKPQSKVEYTKEDNNKLKDIGLDSNSEELLLYWIGYRKQIGKPIKAEVTLIRLAQKIKRRGFEISKKVIDNSIENSYQGLFWDNFQEAKTSNQVGQPKKPSF